MNRLWRSLYSKVKAMALGYVFGGGLTAAATEVLNAVDVTDLSASEQSLYAVAAAAIIGIINAYKRPELGPTPGPVQPLAPGEPEPRDLSDH